MQAIQKGFMAYRGLKARVTPDELASYEAYIANGHKTPLSAKTLIARHSAIAPISGGRSSTGPDSFNQPDPQRGADNIM